MSQNAVNSEAGVNLGIGKMKSAKNRDMNLGKCGRRRTRRKADNFGMRQRREGARGLAMSKMIDRFGPRCCAFVHDRQLYGFGAGPGQPVDGQGASRPRPRMPAMPISSSPDESMPGMTMPGMTMPGMSPGRSGPSQVGSAARRCCTPTAPPAVGDRAGRWMRCCALGLADFERMALQRNPTLKQATAQFEAALNRSHQAGLYPNPVVGYVQDQIGSFSESHADKRRFRGRGASRRRATTWGRSFSGRS